MDAESGARWYLRSMFGLPLMFLLLFAAMVTNYTFFLVLTLVVGVVTMGSLMYFRQYVWYPTALHTYNQMMAIRVDGKQYTYARLGEFDDRCPNDSIAYVLIEGDHVGEVLTMCELNGAKVRFGPAILEKWGTNWEWVPTIVEILSEVA